MNLKWGWTRTWTDEVLNWILRHDQSDDGRDLRSFQERDEMNNCCFKLLIDMGLERILSISFLEACSLLISFNLNYLYILQEYKIIQWSWDRMPSHVNYWQMPWFHISNGLGRECPLMVIINKCLNFIHLMVVVVVSPGVWDDAWKARRITVGDPVAVGVVAGSSARERRKRAASSERQWR